MILAEAPEAASAAPEDASVPLTSPQQEPSTPPPPMPQEEQPPAAAPEQATAIPPARAAAPPPEPVPPEAAAPAPEPPAEVAETAESEAKTDDAASAAPPPAAGPIPHAAPTAGPAALADTAPPQPIAAAAGTGAPSEADLRLLDEAIRNRLRYPAAARKRGAQGTVELEITVNDKGALDRCEIAASSGSSILDDAALRLLSGLFPFRKRLGGAFSTRIAIVYRLD